MATLDYRTLKPEQGKTDYVSKIDTLCDSLYIDIPAAEAATAAVAGRTTALESTVSVDTLKLAGIEAAATADQSNAEIRTAVEAATDSNVFTDADHTKLGTIADNATVDQDKTAIDALGIQATGVTAAASGDITVETVPVYGMVILDTPEYIVNSVNGTLDTWLTPTASSTLSAADAKKAIIRFQATATNSGVGFCTTSVFARTGGSSLGITYAAGTKVGSDQMYHGGGSSSSIAAGEFTVNLDASYQFDYYQVMSATTGTSRQIHMSIVGYYV